MDESRTSAQTGMSYDMTASNQGGAYPAGANPPSQGVPSSAPDASAAPPVPIVTYALIVVNGIVFVLTTLLGPTSSILLSEMRLAPQDVLDPTHCWTLLTSMFVHAGIMHLMANMYSLFVLGSVCEPLFGRRKYLATYFVGGVAGGLLFSAIHLATGTPATAVGASGAIFALMGLYGAFLLLLRRRVREASGGAVPLGTGLDGAWQRYLMLLALNLFVIPMVGNIAWEAHVGGLLAGFAIGMIFPPATLRKAGANGVDGSAAGEPRQFPPNPQM